MPDAEAGRWVPLAEAGRALGLQPDTLRKQAKRGLRDARRDNRGRWLILVKPDKAGPVPDDATWHGPAVRSDGPAPSRSEPDADLLARAAAAEALVAELRAHIAALEAAVEAERRRVDALIMALAAGRQEPARQPWPGLRRWWRRAWEGEG